jgi:hypothetical protein
MTRQDFVTTYILNRSQILGDLQNIELIEQDSLHAWGFVEQCSEGKAEDDSE